MADNLAVTAGSGSTIGMDEVADATLGTVKVGFGKIMDGTLDSTNKLIVSAAGAAKVDGSAVTQPVSAASLPLPTLAATSTKQSDGTQKTQVVDGSGNVIGSTTNALDINIKSGNPTTMPVTNAGTFAVQNTTQKNASPASTTMQNAAVANANGTSLAVDGFSTAIVSITASVAISGGTTINFEASTDNTTFVAIQGINIGTNTIATTTTATGDWQIDVTGYSFLRARISAYSAGTITIKGYPIGIPATSKIVNANIVANTATNQSTNIAQINGTTPLMGSGIMGTGSPRVTIASDNDPVTVKQATAANLNATVVGTGTFATQATLAAETTKVIGTARILGNAGAVVDGVITAATAPANMVAVGGVYNSTEPSPTTGQSVATQLDSKGRARQVIMDAAGNTRGVNVTAGNALSSDVTTIAGTAPTAVGKLNIHGGVATNVAITDNPLNLGAQAVSSENAAVTTARQVQLVADLVGKLIVLPYANPENFVSGAITSAMTGTTTTSLVAAPASGLRNYITQITVSNSHATVGTDIIIQDGSGGTTLYTIPAAAVYGGATVTFPTPLRQPTTATAIFCANVTTGSNTKVSASGYKGA